MRIRNHGKYTRMSRTKPRAIGRCDTSGLMVKHSTMKDQVIYSGQGLISTGFRVHPRFFDKPNAQDLAPIIRLDPVPVPYPRPDNIIGVIPQQTLVLDLLNSDITLTNEQFSNVYFILQGNITSDIVISVPAIFNTFSVINNTIGNFNVSFQIIYSYQTRLEVPKIIKTLISNDSMSLKVIHPN